MRPRLTLARRLAREIDTSWLDERDVDAFTKRMVAAIELGMEADATFRVWLATAEAGRGKDGRRNAPQRP